MVRMLTMGGIGMLLAAACSQQVKPLTVDGFKMRSAKLADHDAAMVRGDQNFVLYGKVSEKEREEALGHYYTVKRLDASDAAVVLFKYQQVETKSKILQKRVTLRPGQSVAEFNFTGVDYLEKGRVLSWKVDLIEKGQVIASEQSYMWE